MCSNKNYANIDYYYENSTNYQNVSISNTSYSNYTSGSNVTNISNFESKPKIKLEMKYLLYIYEGKNNTLDLLNDDIKSVILKAYTCLGNSGTGEEFQPESLKKCRYAKYIEENDTYSCIECLPGYSLNEETNTCIQSIKIEMNEKPGLSNCYVENIGTESSPIYSCKFCYKRNDILIKTESGAKFCETPNNEGYDKENYFSTSVNYELEGCTEANANTKYLNNIYNCTNCSYGYIPYYSRYFQRKICQYIFNDIFRENNLFDSTAFEDVENISAVNGICENNKLFTPDGQHCFACNSREVGMVGCKRSCTFSTKRKNVLECEEEGCKSGYLEKSKGLCESCESINKGCIECHY